MTEYLKLIELRYGQAYFNKFLRFADIIAETPSEALDLQEISWLFEERMPTTREIAFLYDLKPLLIELRDYRGAVYGFANIRWVELIKEIYPDLLLNIALEWEQDLLAMDIENMESYTEIQKRCFLYKASVLALYFMRYEQKIFDKTLLDKIEYIATRYHFGVQNHLLARSKRCYFSLFETYILLLKNDYSKTYISNFLVICNNFLKQHELFGITGYVTELSKNLEDILDLYSNKWHENGEICLKVMLYYSNMLCINCDLYNHKQGLHYYEKAKHLYDAIITKYLEIKDKVDNIWYDINLNILELLRHFDCDTAIKNAQPILKEMQLWKHGYNDVNMGRIIAMCYKSKEVQNHEEQKQSYFILKDCINRIAQLGAPNNAYENRVYIVTYLKYCQCLHEYFDFVGLTLTEIERASEHLNLMLNYIVQLEQDGFSEYSKLKPEMMITAGLMQCKIAQIKSRTKEIDSEIFDHLYTAIQIADKIQEVYNIWDKNKVVYDRVSAMHNFVNIGAIYAVAFQRDKGIQIIEDAMMRYIPQNKMEKDLHNLMRKKFKKYDYMGGTLKNENNNYGIRP